MLANKRLGILGAGEMSEAILAGLIEQQAVARDHISIVNRQNKARLALLADQYQLKHDQCCLEKVIAADVVILAMKPKDVQTFLQDWGAKFQKGQIIISVIAGIQLVCIENFVPPEVAVIRAMPNTSAAVGVSATAITGGTWAESQALEIAKFIFSTVGTVLMVEEKMMDAVTGLSGSGPAYFYYMVEAMESAGVKAGLTPEDARQLTLQTILGAAQMLTKSEAGARELRQAVTSPGGTTMVGIQKFRDYHFAEAVEQAVLAAKKRSADMGAELAKKLLEV